VDIINSITFISLFHDYCFRSLIVRDSN